MGYVTVVVASESWRISYDKTYTTRVSYLEVKHEENPLCELFMFTPRTCSKSTCVDKPLSATFSNNGQNTDLDQC